MRQADDLGVLLALLLIAGCSVTPGECAAGFVLENGFCVRITCEPGQRIVDNACAPIECPPGTTLQGEACGSDDTTTPITEATPPGGLYSGTVTVTLRANEPAVVYYTTDGSTPTEASSNGPSPLHVDIAASGDLRFFSVDPAGNSESPVTEEYTIDDGPDGVTDLTATPSPGGVDLAWTNPSDPLFVGVLVARGRSLPLDWTPENLVEYQVGDVVGPDIVIAAAGNLDSVTDDEPWGDLNGYAVWARDEAFNYSADAATAEVAVRYPPQAFDVTVDLANETASIDQQPRDAYIELAPQISEAKDVVQIGIRVTNKASRPLYNLKAVVDPPSAGAVTAADGTYEGDPTYWFGPHAVPPGQRSIRDDVLVTAIPGGTTTLTVPIRIVSHPLLIQGAFQTHPIAVRFSDPTDTNFSMTGAAPFFEGYPNSADGGQGPGNYRTVSVSPDGTRLYAGHNNVAGVSVVDLTTMTPTLSADLTGPAVTLGQTLAALSPDGEFLYVALTTNVHRKAYGVRTNRVDGGQPIDIQVVKLDATTLAEIDRQDLILDVVNDVINGRRASTIAISQDGTRLAVGVEGVLSEVFYLDTANLGILFQATLPGTRVTSVLISPGNTHIYATSKAAADMSRVDTTTETVTPFNSGWTVGTWGGSLRLGPDGFMYITRQFCSSCPAAPAFGRVARVNLTNDAVVQANQPSFTAGIAFQGNLLFVQTVNGPVHVIHETNFAAFTAIDTFASVANGAHVTWISPSPLWTP